MELLNQMDGFDQTVNVKVIIGYESRGQRWIAPSATLAGAEDRKIGACAPIAGRSGWCFRCARRR